MPPECPACLTHHAWSEPCQMGGIIKRLRARVFEQEQGLRALRAIVRDHTQPEDAR